MKPPEHSPNSVCHEDHSFRNAFLRTATLVGGCALVGQSLFELVARKPIKAAVVATAGGFMIANALSSDQVTHKFN